MRFVKTVSSERFNEVPNFLGSNLVYTIIYHAVYHRNPKPMAAQKAIAAVARKLCERVACILREQRPYVLREASRKTEKEETATLQGTPRLRAETSARPAA